MPDEPSTSATAQEQPATSSEAAETSEPAAPAVDYNALLDSVPDDVLRKHSRFNGYAGRMAQQMAERERERISQEEYQRAERAKLEELEREAEENPFAFSQKWLKGRAEERAKIELAGLRKKTQEDLFAKIGQAYGALPEWQQLSDDEMARVSQAVVGVPEDELVARFNAAALDVVATRRAAARSREQIEAEVQARLQQMNADRLRSETAPDMSSPTSAQGLSDAAAIRGMSDKEFEAFYNRTFRT